jgi:hypothetical protein
MSSELYNYPQCVIEKKVVKIFDHHQILKSKQATETTFLIIETFTKLRALQKTVAAASSTTGNKKNSLLKKSGELMADLLDHDMTETESETTLELNFAVLKLKHTTKRKKEQLPIQK